MAVRISEPQRTRICRDICPGEHLVTVKHDDWDEFFLNLTPLPCERMAGLLDRLAASLRHRRASVLKQTVYASCAGWPDGMAAVRERFGEVDWPITWVEGADCRGGAVAGIQVHAMAGRPVRTLRSGGQPVGRTFTDAEAQYAVLADIRPKDVSAPNPDQGYDVFRAMDDALSQAGLSFHDVVRTWLFVDRILEWYPGLNAARDRYFRETGVFDGLVPASTGIGCANPYGAAMVAEAFAVRPTGGGPGAVTLASPLQCPAPAYGSAFSRAVEVTVGGCRRILVSGTASIEPGGRTAHLGDTLAQCRTTLRIVRALLEARGASLADITRAVAYFRSAEDAHLFDGLWDAGLRGCVPAVVVRADVCRDDLLFEIELDAIA